MQKHKMIMDDVVSTSVENNQEITNNLVNNTNPDISKLVRPRKTRTIIRKFNKKVMPNDPCPCGAIDENGNRKKFKKCCMGNGNFDGIRELTAQEMAQCKYENKPAWRFEENLSINN